MKTWKVRTESGNIGKIKLDEYSVYVTEENITVNIDIVQMSVAIKNELMRAVEIAKKQESKELSQLSKRYGRNVSSVWSDKPVPVIKKFVYLCITYCAGDSVKHYIIMGFEDAENDCLTAECKLAVVPLSYMRKIKERIISRIYNHFI